ncbi:hypothetical protein, partial [Mesorhizobium sp.]|uniref:hypothetical protein n=1 Tax=Mesorhizobium sp. TaxID=1871066 RepID=UPI0025DBC353
RERLRYRRPTPRGGTRPSHDDDQSYGYSGYIARTWTDCPWPLPGRIGFEVVPAFNEAFYGALHVDHIDHSWNENDGLAFRIQNTLGLAGLVVGGKVEFCKISGTIPIGGALVTLGAKSATGSTSLDTPNGDSTTYHVRLTQPIYMLAHVVTPVFSGTVPLWFKLELTKGKIPTTLGQKGSIQITPTGHRRDYVLVVRLDQAAFLPQGLTASGKVDVNWQAPTTLPPTAAGITMPHQ